MADREMVERFWSKVDKNEPVMVQPLGQCWVWTARTSSTKGKGYGRFRWQGRDYPAHRFSYELSTGRPIPVGLVVDHRCFNSVCVNPDHLRAATYGKNGENRSGLAANNTSGVRGVSRTSHGRMAWQVHIGHSGAVHTKRFRTLEEAEAWAVAKRLELFTHNDLDRRQSA